MESSRLPQLKQSISSSLSGVFKKSVKKSSERSQNNHIESDVKSASTSKNSITELQNTTDNFKNSNIKKSYEELIKHVKVLNQISIKLNKKNDNSFFRNIKKSSNEFTKKRDQLETMKSDMEEIIKNENALANKLSNRSHPTVSSNNSTTQVKKLSPEEIHTAEKTKFDERIAKLETELKSSKSLNQDYGLIYKVRNIYISVRDNDDLPKELKDHAAKKYHEVVALGAKYTMQGIAGDKSAWTAKDVFTYCRTFELPTVKTNEVVEEWKKTSSINSLKANLNETIEKGKIEGKTFTNKDIVQMSLIANSALDTENQLSQDDLLSIVRGIVDKDK